jgi:hypothetical protein
LFDSNAFKYLPTDENRNEQEVLTHGLLYAFSRFALPGILRDFEIMTVETGAVEYVLNPVSILGPSHQYIAIQSRPDAIARNRQTHEVAGWSWKSIDDPTDMRRSQLHNDLQGFMEQYYGERILEALRGAEVTTAELNAMVHQMIAELAGLTPVEFANALENIAHAATERVRATRNIPTNIDYIQTVFLIKGKRRLMSEVAMPMINAESYDNADDEYNGYAPDRIYRQMSHLCYKYRNGNVETLTQELYKTGPKKGLPKPQDIHDPNLIEESWAYRFYKPTNETMSSLSTKWLVSAIQPGDVRAWVDKLMEGAVYPSTMNDSRNPNPIEKLILMEQPLYRDPQRAARHVEQQRQRYIQIGERVQQMNTQQATPGTLQAVSLAAMDEHFPQQLINCKTPFKCAYHDFCHTAAESELDFVNVPSGFELRVPHHEAEREWRLGTDESA